MNNNSTQFFSYISRKTFLRVLLASFLGSLVFLVILGLKADWINLYSDLNILWLMAASLGVALLQLINGYRLFRLIPPNVPHIEGSLSKSIKVMALFQVLLKVLPFRLGEMGFFWLMKKHINLQFKSSFGLFLTFRLWDLRIVAFSFLVFGGGLLNPKYSEGALFFILVGVLGLSLFVLSSARLIKVGEFFLRRASQIIPKYKKFSTLADTLAKTSIHLNHLEGLKTNILVGILSVILWVVYYAVFYCLLRAVGMQLAWHTIIAIASGSILISILPIQTLGGLGMLEFGQASLLILAGIPSSLATNASLAVGILFLSTCLIIPSSIVLIIKTTKKVSQKT